MLSTFTRMTLRIPDDTKISEFPLDDEFILGQKVGPERKLGPIFYKY